MKRLLFLVMCVFMTCWCHGQDFDIVGEYYGIGYSIGMEDHPKYSICDEDKNSIPVPNFLLAHPYESFLYLYSDSTCIFCTSENWDIRLYIGTWSVNNDYNSIYRDYRYATLLLDMKVMCIGNETVRALLSLNNDSLHLSFAIHDNGDLVRVYYFPRPDETISYTFLSKYEKKEEIKDITKFLQYQRHFYDTVYDVYKRLRPGKYEDFIVIVEDSKVIEDVKVIVNNKGKDYEIKLPAYWRLKCIYDIDSINSINSIPTIIIP